MAGRGNKVNLDYFELDCHMDEKVRMIQAEYGLKGFAVFVKLLQRIYGENGYYCEWTQDRELLFMSENGLDSGSLQLLRDIVSACIRRNIFSERLFKKYGILTSSGVQKQYLKATVKREAVELKKEYLLISVPQNRTNVAINSISVGINSISVGINEQSIEEKSIEEKKRVITAKASAEPKLETENIQIPLNDGSFYKVQLEKIKEWKEAFPAVDIEVQLRGMAAWCNANPKKRKTRRGIQRFIVNWLSSEQDKAGRYYVGNKKETSTQNRESKPVQNIGMEEDLIDDEEWWKYGLNAMED